MTLTVIRRTRSRLLWSIVLSLLATFLLSGCPQYGGPYPIGGANGFDGKLASDKLAEFDEFKSKKKWDSSEVVELNRKLFSDSIKSNSVTGIPHADDFQRYNYVIQGSKIFVAVWKNSKPAETGTHALLSDICNPGLPYSGMKDIQPGMMVNFYPELRPDAPTPDPKCIATVGGKPTGVLDAHSKHFMLAHGKGAMISKYLSGWQNSKVEYAGEIIVSVKPCYYTINQGSGTYKPSAGSTDKDFKHLEAVAQFFSLTIGVSPAFVWRTDSHLVQPVPNQRGTLFCSGPLP